MQPGDRVRIAHHEFSFYKRLHSYNQLAWSSRMATYIGKNGIVEDVTMQCVQVTIYSWRTFDGTVTLRQVIRMEEISRKWDGMSSSKQRIHDKLLD